MNSRDQVANLANTPLPGHFHPYDPNDPDPRGTQKQQRKADKKLRKEIIKARDIMHKEKTESRKANSHSTDSKLPSTLLAVIAGVVAFIAFVVILSSTDIVPTGPEFNIGDRILPILTNPVVSIVLMVAFFGAVVFASFMAGKEAKRNARESREYKAAMAIMKERNPGWMGLVPDDVAYAQARQTLAAKS